MVNENERRALLSGIRILDLADEKASFCSRVLADLGAEVIKVEKPGGDPARLIGPFINQTSNPDHSLSFLYHNANKLGITCNLEHEEGQGILKRLVKQSAVVVESFKPGFLESQGLGYKRLAEINPGVILVSVTGFGQTGPKNGFKSCDLVAAAFGGQMYITGDKDAPPLKYYGDQSYYTASLQAAIGIMLAIRRNRQSQKGAWIDISLQESVASTLEHVFPNYFFKKEISQRNGNRIKNNGFCVLPCRDGFIQLTIQLQWQLLVEWMERDGMAGELTGNEWLSFEYRKKHFDRLVKLLMAWTQTYSVGELIETAQLMRLPWAPVASPKDVLRSPQLNDRRFFEDLKITDMDTEIKFPKMPFNYDANPHALTNRAPRVAEHNEQIYTRLLGLSKAELDQLTSLKVI